jgi:Protein of unknown function (DUF1176)
MGYVSVSVSRRAGRATPVLAVAPIRAPSQRLERDLSIAVDGIKVAGPFPNVRRLNLDIDAAMTAQVLRQMVSTRQFELVKQDGTVFATASLDGFLPAMLAMDQMQGVLASSVSSVRSYGSEAVDGLAAPVVIMARASAGAPAQLSSSDQRNAESAFGCPVSGAAVSRHPPQLFRLDAETTLALIASPCERLQAFNVDFRAMLIGNDGKARPAMFDTKADARMPHGLVNASWDGAARWLTSTYKAREIGDCGISQIFAWDGMRLRLITQQDMPVCRRAARFLTTWQARTVSSPGLCGPGMSCSP